MAPQSNLRFEYLDIGIPRNLNINENENGNKTGEATRALRAPGSPAFVSVFVVIYV